MEMTVCPWCHSEIVWDEEFGPEEHCPHCGNELGGYRTVNIGSDDLDEEDEETIEMPEPEETALWEDEDADSGVVPVLNALDPFRDDFDMGLYELRTASAIDGQLDVPECPRCHEYMMKAGSRTVSEFAGEQPAAVRGPVLKAPFALNMYVCPSCFTVHESLDEEARQQLVRNMTAKP